MKKDIALLLLVFISVQAFAKENVCEKIWNNRQDNIEVIKIEKIISHVLKFGKM